MARPGKTTPSYLLHENSAHARAVWTDAAGLPHQLPDTDKSKESRLAFAKRSGFPLVLLPVQPRKCSSAGKKSLALW